MSKTQKTVLLILAVLGLIYFAIFLIPNLTGAKDATMLSVFENDEYAQYPHVIRMITAGDTPMQTIRNFVVYLHYYYGYPFYFFSALSILPVKWIIGADWQTQTQTLVAVLRQMINVLPMIMAVLILVWNQTKFKTLWKAVFLFLFLLSLRGVVENNLWWHPDSLLVLFSVLTIFFLMRDQGKFGRNFYLSGIMCALAIGTKVLGVLFILTYISYLVYGLVTRSISFRKLVVSSLLFLVVLFGSIIASNPLLLLPIERGEIIAIFKANYALNSQGFWIFGNGSGNRFEQIGSIINESFNGLILFFTSLAILVIGLFDKNRRLNNLIILTWIVGFLGYFLLNVSSFRTHYLLPAMVPLYSAILDLFPDEIRAVFRPEKTKKKWSIAYSIVGGLFILLLVFYLSGNTWKGYEKIKNISQRERTSQSLALYNEFSGYLPKFPQEEDITFYRDWRAYVAEEPTWIVEYNWDLASYDYIKEINADVLFVEYDNALYFSDEIKLESAVDPASMQKKYAFYSDVIDENVDLYTLFIKNDFGYVFVSDDFYSEYLK